MALTINTNIVNDTDQYLLDAKNVKGGYITVVDIASRDALPKATIVKGSLCYVTGTDDTPVNEFYQYNGHAWELKVFGITTDATTETSGLMSAEDKKKLNEIAAKAEVNVQSDWSQTDDTADDYIKNKPLVPILNDQNLIPSEYLPSYVDDVIEVADHPSLPTNGESGKIYITLDDNKTYRWSGSTYAEISSSLALGEESSTAYAGNKGKQNASNIVILQSQMSTAQTDITNIKNGTEKVGKAGEAEKLSTNAGNATQPVYFANGVPVNTTYTLGASVPSDAKFTDTTYNEATTSAAGLMSAADKQKLQNLKEEAQKNVQSNWNETNPSSDAFIQDKPVIGALASKDTIDKTDLAKEVKDSLELADSALQSHQDISHLATKDELSTAVETLLDCLTWGDFSTLVGPGTDEERLEGDG